MEAAFNTAQSDTDKQQALQLICNSFAKIMTEFNIDSAEIIDGIKISLVNDIINKNPMISNLELSLKTGIDRRKVADFKGKSLEPKTTKLLKIMSKIRDYFTKHDITELPLNQGVPSFKSLVYDMYNKTESYKSVAHELIQGGFFELKKVHGIDMLFYQGRGLMYKDNQSRFLETIGKIFSDASETVISNYNNPDDRILQKRLISNQISPSQFKEVLQECRHPVELCLEQVAAILDSHEEDTEPGTYPEVGFDFISIAQKQ